jgi:hypothetical protein
MMTCKSFQRDVSDYADFHADERMRVAMHAHASDCPACRKLLEETQTLRRELSKLPEPALSPVFSREIVAALDAAAARRAAPASLQLSQAAHWLSKRPLMAGYGVGLVMTLALFAITLASLKPMLRWVQPPQYDIVYMPKEEMRPFMAHVQPTANMHLASHPTLEFEGELARLPEALFLTNEDGGGVVILAEVGPNGRAQCVRLVSPHNTPETIATVNAALSGASFQPAMRRGRAVSSKIVLLMEHIYIRG